MSMTETLRVQIDALRIEKQQLEVEIVRFREKRPDQGALIDKEAVCMSPRRKRQSNNRSSQLKSEKEGLVVETGQLKAVYNNYYLKRARISRRRMCYRKSAAFRTRRWRSTYCSDINFNSHNEHMLLSLLIHWVTQVTTYEDCISLMQLPTETICCH